MAQPTFIAADNVTISVATSDTRVTISDAGPWPSANALTVFLALRTGREIGAAVLPFEQNTNGSTVFLPFKADLLLGVRVQGDSATATVRRWDSWKWSDWSDWHDGTVTFTKGVLRFHIDRGLSNAQSVAFASYIKDLGVNNGWGWFFGCSDNTVIQGAGDKYIRRYYEVDLGTGRLKERDRTPELRLYQLFVRLFGNTNKTSQPNGTLAQNGVGKFKDINGKALTAIADMGFTHIWLTGALQQATGTDYSTIGRPADDPDLLKGIAGSPYAIKDYFDVCPDYAVDPRNRLAEFRSLLDRIHSHDLKVLIDFIPNHVARSYSSSNQPESDFGRADDRTQFFHPQNNFFYLQLGKGPPLRLPTWKDGRALSPTCQLYGMACDGLFQGELDHGKVTGNNAATWTPGLSDWYETVKLNYGFDFTDAQKLTREYPSAWSPRKAAPDTWRKMDRVLEYWQTFGVDGFRCDMAHLVPPEFWSWAIDRARRRQADIVFISEAYDNDPAKVPGSDPVIGCLNNGAGNVKYDLLNAGFDAVYDEPTYRALQRIYEGGGWANDIDDAVGDPFICENSLRFAENHDEVRLAAAGHWGSIGMQIGRPVSAILFGLTRSSLLLYNGQEVGEPASGAEGFGGDDGRTSIFDYWSMPEFAKWVNHHHYDGAALSENQRELRAFYSGLLRLVSEPAFVNGDSFPLNPTNRHNEHYGRLPNEAVSGHWFYSFLRHDRRSHQSFLVAVNLHPALALNEVQIFLPQEALEFLGLPAVLQPGSLSFTDRLEAGAEPQNVVGSTNRVFIATLPPLSARYVEITIEVQPT